MKSRVDRNNVPKAGSAGQRTAVGYVRVSTDMQAADGLSLDAQRATIRAFCESTELRLLQIHEDVESGGRADRRGLAKALATPSDVVVVLKFDRISRSIKHFCDLYEEHFSDGTKELVAIRESIRLDSALGRALVGILLCSRRWSGKRPGREHERRSFTFGRVDSISERLRMDFRRFLRRKIHDTESFRRTPKSSGFCLASRRSWSSM